MAHKRPARERAKTSHRASSKVARMSLPDHIYPSTDEDSYDDFLPNIRLGSPTLDPKVNLRNRAISEFISGSDSEEERTYEQTPEREKLFENLLNAIQSPSHQKYGSFASCEGVKYSHDGLIMKSFHVEDAGELRVPLSADDVSKLRKLRGVCEKPECLEIDASKITFLDAPEFISNTIQPLAMHAVRKLSRYGAAVPLTVQLHKLLLCDSGGDKYSLCHDFTCRVDAGEEKGLFASLVLQIPTEEGYETYFKRDGLKVRHRQSKKTFHCDFVSSIGFCYSVFFADCNQQWSRVKSGARLCMIFNLFRQDSFVQALQRDFIACKVREAESALQPWLSDVMKGKCDIYSPKLAIPLSYKYGKDELFFDEVKGDDRIVLEVLKTFRDEDGKQLLDLHLCLVPDSKCGDRVTDSSSPRDPNENYFNDNVDDPFAHCDRHHGDRDESNHHAQGWDSKFCSPSYWYNILAACVVSDPVSNEEDITSHRVSHEEKITFWTGETDKLSIAFGHLGLDKREVVVGYLANHSEYESESEGYRLKYWEKVAPGCCNRVWYRAMLVVWPRELSISVFCETKLSLALDLLEMTIKINDPEFCKHLLRILCWCDNNASRVWAMDCKFDLVMRLIQLCRRARDFGVWGYDSKSDLVIPTLFHLCTRADQLKEVLSHVFKLLAKGDIRIGIMNRKVAKEVAAVIQVYGWTISSSLLLELVKQWALFQGLAFVRLAKELFLIDLEDVGNIVGKTIIEVFKARIKELETRTKPEFSWCQPQAKFPSNAMIENFLKGPQERFLLNDFETDRHASYFLRDIMKTKNVRIDRQFHGEVIDENGRSVVELLKTTRHFEISMEHWKGIPSQLVALRTELRRVKSALRRAEAVGVKTFPNVDGETYVQRAGEFSDEYLETFF